MAAGNASTWIVALSCRLKAETRTANSSVDSGQAQRRVKGPESDRDWIERASGARDVEDHGCRRRRRSTRRDGGEERARHPQPGPWRVDKDDARRTTTPDRTRSGSVSSPPVPHATLHVAHDSESRLVLTQPCSASCWALIWGGRDDEPRTNVRRRERSGRGENGAYVETSGREGRGEVDGNSVGCFTGGLNSLRLAGTVGANMASKAAIILFWCQQVQCSSSRTTSASCSPRCSPGECRPAVNCVKVLTHLIAVPLIPGIEHAEDIVHVGVCRAVVHGEQRSVVWSGCR